MRTKHEPRAVVGPPLAPGQLLTKEQCWDCARLGEDSLAIARQSGMVNALYVGKYAYYESTELIAWLRKVAKQVQRPRVAG